jgi:D-alanyl-D-alanine carboxypeptidase
LEPFDAELAALLQATLDELVADGYIPGAVLSVSVPGREPWTGASGIQSRQTGTPMQPDTRVRIASISKVFTAIVVLQLYEEGRIDLDTPVAQWFPNLLPRGNETTVRNLLNHTSGLYDYLEDPSFGLAPYRNPGRTWQPQELVEFATQYPLSFGPGAAGGWDYSSTNYVVLGMIVEQVTGTSLAQEMEARIFGPLGLDSTYFRPEQEIEGVLASGYSNAADVTNTSMSYAFATANLVSTASDVRRFGEGLFGGELLEPETLALMQTFENGYGQYNMPELEYGLGIMRHRLPVGPQPDGLPRPAEASRVMGHIGGFGGFRSALWHSPNNGITIALAVNQFSTDPNTLATRAFDAVLTAQDR